MATNPTDNPFEQAALVRARADITQRTIITLPDTKALTKEERQSLANFRAQHFATALNYHLGVVVEQAIKAVRLSAAATYTNTVDQLAVIKSPQGRDPAFQPLVEAFLTEQAKELGADLHEISNDACEHIREAGKRPIAVEPRNERITFADWLFQE
jgi:hypothetical protein